MDMLKKNYFVFALLFVFCGYYSVNVGVEGSLELLLYHFWNGYSFVTERYLSNMDFAFCGVQSFFNPLFDAGFYLLAKALNNFPKLFLFLQGFFPACGLFFLYKLVGVLVKNQKWQLSAQIFAVIFASTTLLFNYQLGTTLMDLQLCFLSLAGLYLFFKYKNNENLKTQYLSMFSVGCMFGMATGFKLTFAIYAIAFFLAVTLFAKQLKNPVKSIGLCVLGLCAGYVLINGFWAVHLWKTHGSPVFPFYNNIFHSDLTTSVSYKAMEHFPENTLQWLAYPIFWGRNAISKVIYVPFDNTGWVISYLAILSYWILKPIKKWRNSKVYVRFCENIDIKTLDVLLVFVIISYILWLNMFSVLRYAVLLDFFVGVIIFLLIISLNCLIERRYLYWALLLVLLFQINASFDYPDHFRRMPEKLLFTAEDKHLPDGAVVFSAGFPVSFAAAYQNPKSHFVYGFNDPVLEFEYTDKSSQIVNDYIAQNPDNVYALFGALGFGEVLLPEQSVWWSDGRDWFINRDSCKILENNFLVNEEYFVALCKVKQD